MRLVAGDGGQWSRPVSVNVRSALLSALCVCVGMSLGQAFLVTF
jgi:hypothetical protein